jgi:phosphoribosylamine--glycine ligase
MKNRNPGIARLAKDLLLIKETEVAKIIQFANSHRIGLAVIGPEAPLEAGLSDALRAEGIKVVGGLCSPNIKFQATCASGSSTILPLP